MRNLTLGTLTEGPRRVDSVEELGIVSKQRREGRRPEKILLSACSEYTAAMGSHRLRETNLLADTTFDDAWSAAPEFFNEIGGKRKLGRRPEADLRLCAHRRRSSEPDSIP